MDELKLIDDKISEMLPLFSRMDEDQQLYVLTPYKMKMLPPRQYENMPDVANVTLNDPLQFATKAIAIISGAQRQSIVEGDIPDKQASKIEEFLDLYFWSADERLRLRGIPCLDNFINEQICIRGRIVARSCPRIEDGLLIPDLLPIDGRSFVYEIGEEGFVWAAAIYQRSKTSIKDTYNKEIKNPTAEVIDFWTPEENVIFVERDEVKRQPNPYREVPFVLSICPIGVMLNSDIEHQGESIYWGNRGLYEEKNRTASILQTLNIMSLFSPMQYESLKGENANKPADSPYGSRKVLPVEKGGGYRPMPISDIKNATSLFYSILESSLQKGSLTALDYGNLTFPLSAVAITALTGARDDIFLPRIQAIALFYQTMSKMVIEQAKDLGELRLGEAEYSQRDLQGHYTIKYRFYTISKEQTTADLTIASAAQGFLSRDTIRRDILQLQNPDEEETKFLAEQAENSDEVLFFYRRAKELIENGQELEAYILAKRGVAAIEQRKVQNKMIEAQASLQASGQQNTGRKEIQPAIPSQPQVRGREIMPLLSATSGGGGQKQKSKLTELPTEPGEEEKLRG